MATTLDRAGLLTGRPFWLKLDPEPIYGVLHTPEEGSRVRTAALILPTFGWDNECSYRARHDWATALAGAGVMTARFDFPGTEDSVGSPLGVGRFRSWIDATGEAAQWLRHVSGCERLVAIGIGLGGMVAYQAAADGAPIDDLVLWAVRGSGRVFMREQQAFATVATDGPPDARDRSRTDGVIGLAGHAMSAETVEAISGVDLAATELPDAGRRRVLLIGRDTAGVDGRLRARLETAGAAVTAIDSDDYRDLMMTPELSLTPKRTIEISRDWILEDAAIEHQSVVHRASAAVPTAADAIEFDWEGIRLRERLLEVESPVARVFGVITEAVEVARQPFCTVSLNTASLRRTGPNRILVEVARRAAATGTPAVRFDLPGLGDSEGTAPMVFERYPEHDAESLAVLSAVYDDLAALGVAEHFVAIGCCLGGYLAICETLAGSRSVGLIAVNPAFRWGPRQRLAHRRWRDVLRGDIPGTTSDEQAAPKALPALVKKWLWGLRRFAEKRAAALLRSSALLARLWSQSFLTQVRRTIHDLGVTGLPVCLVFSSTGLAVADLVRGGRATRELRRWSNIRFARLDTPSHLLHPLWSQEELYNHIHEYLAEVAAFVAQTERVGSDAGSGPVSVREPTGNREEVPRVI